MSDIQNQNPETPTETIVAPEAAPAATRPTTTPQRNDRGAPRGDRK